MARSSLVDRKPWTELLDRSVFSRPNSLSEAISRLRRNLGYFRVNYAVVVAFSLAASLLAHPFSLLVLLSILGAWCFLCIFRPSDQPVVLFGHTFTDRETLLGLVVASVLAFFLMSMASLIISGLLVGGAVEAAAQTRTAAMWLWRWASSGHGGTGGGLPIEDRDDGNEED